MHKPNQQQNPDGDAPLVTNQAKTGLTVQAIWETMKRPECTAEQLPALWQQVMEPGETRLNCDRLDQWLRGIGAMYRRCETYPQHAKIAVVVSGMPNSAWRSDDWIMAQARNLLKQATPEQLQQALACGQQHPTGWWQPSDHILTWAAIEQLTGQILEQIDWNSGMAAEVTTPGDETTGHDRWRHIVEQIQQQLLDGDKNSWTVFHGIVEPGNNIGDSAELAKAIEQLNGSGRNRA